MKWVEFYEHYDKLIADWLDDDSRETIIAEDCYFAAERKKKRNVHIRLSTERLEIPEPYFGNPEDCSAVIINLNPGASGDDTRNGYYTALAHLLSTSKFSDFAKSFPCLEKDHPGYRFWSQKNTWIQRLCGKGNEHLRPFAMELCPYHSKKWNGNFIDDNVRAHIQKWVLEPAFAAVKHSRLPFALAIGKNCFDELTKRFGFAVEAKWESRNPIFGWPQNEKGYINRYFAMLQNGTTKVLCTWCLGGTNSAPAESFSEVEQIILTQYADVKL